MKYDPQRLWEAIFANHYAYLRRRNSDEDDVDGKDGDVQEASDMANDAINFMEKGDTPNGRI